MTMTVEQLVEKLGGYYLMNKARAVVDGRDIAIGVITPTGYEFTEEGLMAAEVEASTIEVTPVEVPAPAPRRSRAAAIGLVQSSENTGSEAATEKPAE